MTNIELYMNLFLDCEFNGFGGELISMALVDGEGNYFYEVLPCLEPINWVKENVLPVLDKQPIEAGMFKKRLRHFLSLYPKIHVIADWPEDLALFSRALVVDFGSCMKTPPLTMQLWMDRTLPVNSERPHNALSDAQALAKSYLLINQ